MAIFRGVLILVFAIFATGVRGQKVDSGVAPAPASETSDVGPKKPLFPGLFLAPVQNPYFNSKPDQAPNPYAVPPMCILPQGTQLQPQQRQYPFPPPQQAYPPQQQQQQYQKPPQQYQPYPQQQAQPFPQGQYQHYPQPQNAQPYPPPPQQYAPYQQYPGSDPSRSRASGARNLNFDGVPQPQQYNPDYSNLIQPEPLSQGPQKAPSRPFLTPPTLTYKIGIIADLGSDAKVDETGKFQSFLKEGKLSLQTSPEDPTKYNITVEFKGQGEHHVIESGLNNKEEGFELSTLNVFNGKLYSCDDETGIVYELVRKEQNDTTPKNETYSAQPWVILPNDGENTGFKCEWATVKDGNLWIGSTGILVRKPDDENENESQLDKTRQGVKVVTPNGKITHLDWSKNYEKISEAIGIHPDKGFAVHEAVAWSDIFQKWLFTPRRVSSEKYDKAEYHKKGGNSAIFVGDDFENWKVESFGNLTETSGFTSIKFIPGTEDQLILALKAGLDKETNELVSTLEVYDLEGNEVMAETRVATGIYAGVEFL